MVSSASFAIDYSHPAAPSNTTDCVSYATTVVEIVERMIKEDYDRSMSMEEYLSGIDERIEDKASEGEELSDNAIFLTKAIARDAFVWYRSAKYGFNPEMTYAQLRMECEMGVIDKDYEEDMKDLERFMGN